MLITKKKKNCGADGITEDVLLRSIPTAIEITWQFLSM
jgi:hypothetical protein